MQIGNGDRPALPPSTPASSSEGPQATAPGSAPIAAPTTSATAAAKGPSDSFAASPAAPASPASASATAFANALKPPVKAKAKASSDSSPQAARALATPPHATASTSPIAMFKAAFAESRQWQTKASIYVNNDNAATLLDGRYRSDDGPTSAMGLRIDRSSGALETHLTLDHSMYTERGWGIGTDRTDLVELKFAVGQTDEGRAGGIFDRQRTIYSLGVALNGDYGGAKIQDGWHSAMKGTALTGRLLDGSQFGVKLQDHYTGNGMAVTLGYDVEGQRDLAGALVGYTGSRGQAALGGAGVSALSVFAGLRAGAERGLFANYEIELGMQAVNGNTMNFDGAPVDGFVAHHRASLGYRFSRVEVGLDFVSNSGGTQRGFGDLDGHTLGLRAGFSW